MTISRPKLAILVGSLLLALIVAAVMISDDGGRPGTAPASLGPTQTTISDAAKIEASRVRATEIQQAVRGNDYSYAGELVRNALGNSDYYTDRFLNLLADEEDANKSGDFGGWISTFVPIVQYASCANGYANPAEPPCSELYP